MVIKQTKNKWLIEWLWMMCKTEKYCPDNMDDEKEHCKYCRYATISSGRFHTKELFK